MKLLRLLLCIPALLFVAILRLARGRIKIGILQANRIGHLAGNTEVYLCERDAGLRPKSLDIWVSPPPANEYLLHMWSSVLHIDPTNFALIVLKVNRMFKGFGAYEVQEENYDRDVHNLFEKQPPHLSFTKSECKLAREMMYDMGLRGERFVCLAVRDAAYLPELDYHSYRDSDIDDYLQAATELTERGYVVIRMGAKVAQPLVTSNPRIIDYATNGMRSEFMDLWLGAHCEFCISTGSGFDAIPYVFRRPICYVNYVPLEYLFTFAQGSLAIWKHHVKDGKRMTPAEIYASGAGHFMSAAEYEDAGITLVDNTPQEIADVVIEMAESPTYYLPHMALDQLNFWHSFPRSASTYTKRPLHGEIRMRIGSRFLDGYQR